MDIQTASFSGHESFPLRNTWLTKGVQACADDPRVFSKEDAMVTLGVGKNMVRAIRFLGSATGTLGGGRLTSKREVSPTPFGERLLADGGWDPYMEHCTFLENALVKGVSTECRRSDC